MLKYPLEITPLEKMVCRTEILPYNRKVVLAIYSFNKYSLITYLQCFSTLLKKSPMKETL